MFELLGDGIKMEEKVCQIGEKYKHVDNHALWIDDTNTKHLLVGCDGGVYKLMTLAPIGNSRPTSPLPSFTKYTDNSLPFYGYMAEHKTIQSRRSVTQQQVQTASRTLTGFLHSW